MISSLSPLARLRLSAVSSATVAIALLVPSTAKAEDPVGSYGGASYGINRNDDSDQDFAADGVFSVGERFQARATIGDGVVIVSPTVSFSTGQWRFAAGPGVKFLREQVTIDFPVEERDINGEPTGEFVEILDPETNEPTGEFEMDSIERQEDSLSLIGLVSAERAIGDYTVVYGNVVVSDEISGAIGIGFRF